MFCGTHWVSILFFWFYLYIYVKYFCIHWILKPDIMIFNLYNSTLYAMYFLFSGAVISPLCFYLSWYRLCLHIVSILHLFQYFILYQFSILNLDFNLEIRNWSWFLNFNLYLDKLSEEGPTSLVRSWFFYPCVFSWYDSDLILSLSSRSVGFKYWVQVQFQVLVLHRFNLRLRFRFGSGLN